MTVKEFIHELQKLDPDLPVCAESETGNWDLTTRDIQIKEVNTQPYRSPEIYKWAVVVGYTN